MTGSPSTTGSSDPSRGRRCRRGPCRAVRRLGLEGRIPTGFGGGGRAAGAVVGTTGAGAHVENVGRPAAHSAARRPDADGTSPAATATTGARGTGSGRRRSAPGRAKRVRRQGIQARAVGRGGQIRSAHRSLRRAGRKAVSAVGFGDAESAQDMEGHAAHVTPRSGQGATHQKQCRVSVLGPRCSLSSACPGAAASRCRATGFARTRRSGRPSCPFRRRSMTRADSRRIRSPGRNRRSAAR